jgi:2-oxoglutarate ferredoxin oxidoreductase subunit beta
MTGGQMSPTTHLGDKSTTSVYGNVEPAFDLCELAHAAGATYVARGTSWAYQQLTNVIAGGIAHKGFAMVEAMAICPVYYGRFNLTSDPAEFLRSQKEHAVPAGKFDEGESRVREHYPVGLLHHTERDEFVASLAKVNEKAQEASRG